jgi:hypothetical protein
MCGFHCEAKIKEKRRMINNLYFISDTQPDLAKSSEERSSLFSTSSNEWSPL